VVNVAYAARRGVAEAEKRAIGMRAAAMIPDGCSVIVNVGTTTEEVARALVERRDLVVITNNLTVVAILSGIPGKELILAGGIVRQTDGAVVGDEAVAFMRRFKADYAVIGASALDEDGAILDYDMREVAVARAIIENARRTVLVADVLKFERSAPVRICDVSDIHAFVTDAPPPRAFAQACARAGVEVAVAELPLVEAAS
jgi:DeoR family glycerol-3-phosphate regulon repressor